MKRSVISLLIAISIMSILLPTFVHAGYIGDNIPISAVAYNQQNPYIIYLPDKNLYFAVWEDWRNITTTGADIRARFIDENGGFCGNEIVITGASGNQTSPWAAYRNNDLFDPATGNDTILIVWQDTRGTTNNGYVYFRAMDITSLNTTDCSGYSLGTETPIGYNQIDEFVSPSKQSYLLGTGNGSTQTFSGYLPNTPVVPDSVTVTDGSQTLSDDGQGGLSGDGSGEVNYVTGFITVTFTDAPANGTNIMVDYYYYYIPPPTPLGDTLR
ncbi:MAG: hypothetical protein Fur0020_05050 [Thermodesulfovibrionia bacterium]